MRPCRVSASARFGRTRGSWTTIERSIGTRAAIDASWSQIDVGSRCARSTKASATCARRRATTIDVKIAPWRVVQPGTGGNPRPERMSWQSTAPLGRHGARRRWTLATQGQRDVLPVRGGAPTIKLSARVQRTPGPHRPWRAARQSMRSAASLWRFLLPVLGDSNVPVSRRFTLTRTATRGGAIL